MVVDFTLYWLWNEVLSLQIVVAHTANFSIVYYSKEIDAALNRCPFLLEKLASLQMDPTIDHIATKVQVIQISISGNGVFGCYTIL
jgi:hypothetical protein